MRSDRSVLDGSRTSISCAVLWCACLITPQPGFGQRPDADVRLEVRDPSGAAVQAAGRWENLATGAGESFQTDAEGSYTLRNLARGRYRVSISRTGFASQTFFVDVRSGPTSRTITLAVAASPINTLITVLPIRMCSSCSIEPSRRYAGTTEG